MLLLFHKKFCGGKEKTMKQYLNRLEILNYLDRCCMRLTIEDLQREINKIKNLIEEQDVAELRKLFDSD